MANITRRDDGRWRARYRDVAGNEHSRHFARKVDAQAWLDDVTTAVRTGTYADPRRGASRSAIGRHGGSTGRRIPSRRRMDVTQESCAST